MLKRHIFSSAWLSTSLRSSDLRHRHHINCVIFLLAGITLPHTDSIEKVKQSHGFGQVLLVTA